MTKKHLQFCIYYMQTGDQQVAYKMAYPHAAVKSLKASASRLMARPDVAEWVNGTEERVHNRMMRQFHSEHYDHFKEKLLTINEKRTVLTKIIKGETKRVRYVKVKYGVQKVEEDLPADTVLRAIDLDTRLENFYNYLTRSDTWRKTQNIYVNTPTLQQQVNILINQTSENEETKNAEVEITSPRPGDLGVDSRRDIPPLNLAQRSHEHMRVTPEVPHEHGAEDVYSRSTGNTTSDNTSPRPGVPIAIGIEVDSRRDIPPYKEVPHEHGAEDVHSRSTGNTSPRLGHFGSGKLSPAGGGVTAVTGVEHSRRTDNTSPRPGDLGVHSRSIHHKHKTPRYLSAKSTGSLQKKNSNRLTTVNNLNVSGNEKGHNPTKGVQPDSVHPGSPPGG